ncbi:ATP-binding cassette domain-containing protein [Bacillus sp. RO2]|uniref:ABC transporter ATP-binding protein n=1 Tax=Bacillus sp. RO2 TaxID=2723913 RepID=UPI00145CD586|nr:ATP-binding cassette domain-containing protein [Bacillus sp. RO2]NMH72015.1 ATP-binding cassette domain-containing protein [Bacillus sp. RO2]
MIQVKQLTKRFGSRTLFHNLTFTVEKGEFAIISGKSGCGKTTLLNIIGGIEEADEGSVLVNDIEITKKFDKKSYYGETVSFIFQNFALIENKTVKQNFDIIGKKNRSGISYDEALAKVGLPDKLNERIYTLSGGEQQRIALARTYLKKADIILADEPTGSLDRGNANRIMNILKDLNEDGKTVIIVTHDEMIKEQAPRLIEIR